MASYSSFPVRVSLGASGIVKAASRRISRASSSSVRPFSAARWRIRASNPSSMRLMDMLLTNAPPNDYDTMITRPRPSFDKLRVNAGRKGYTPSPRTAAPAASITNPGATPIKTSAAAATPIAAHGAGLREGRASGAAGGCCRNIRRMTRT